MDAAFATTSQEYFYGASILAGFIVLLLIGSLILPEPRPVLAGSGQRHSSNGLKLFILTLGLVALGNALGWISLAALPKYVFALFVSANGFAFALTLLMFLRGQRRARTEHVGRGGRSTGVLRDLFFGTELNPSFAGVDLKVFSYRPSLIGLALINLSFAATQVEIYGSISTPMVLYQVFTLGYVLNYFQFEEGMLNTWDVRSERFGWMLIWGDFVLVPFFYSLPGWFLVHRTETIPVWGVVALTALYLFGFWLFRGANEQKHRFKSDPATRIWGKPAETIGGCLLVSGFWGLGRHLNYTGELAIYLAFTLTTGFDSLLPYALPAWLTLLLVHRAWRDDRHCHAKYGQLWTLYTGRVRFRMVPFLY